MANKIPNLWPSAVSVETLPPVAILRVQAQNLTQMTHGLLQGEVISADGDPEAVRHHLDVVAPGFNGYRFRILTVQHGSDLVYPVSLIHPAAFSTEEIDEYENPYTIRPTAYSEDEFIQILKDVFQSGHVLSVINSLIAQSNESLMEKQPAGKELQPA